MNNNLPSGRVLPAVSVLLELAARCEREEPNRALDADIAVTFGWRALPGDTWVGPEGGAVAAPDFTRSIDAAVTLVPEGTRWGVGGNLVCAAIGTEIRTTGKTSALALCAAALRARSATHMQDIG